LTLRHCRSPLKRTFDLLHSPSVVSSRAPSKEIRTCAAFLGSGHIAAVEEWPGLSDEEAVAKSGQMFNERKASSGYGGFEVWQLSRMVIQHPPVETEPEVISSSPNETRPAGAFLRSSRRSPPNSGRPSIRPCASARVTTMRPSNCAIRGTGSTARSRPPSHERGASRVSLNEDGPTALIPN